MFTDTFGQTISPGDEVAIAVGSGRSEATLHRTTVIALVPLVPHRDQPESLMRADQANKPYPSRFPSHSGYGQHRKVIPADKRYVLQGQTLSYINGSTEKRTKLRSFPHVDNIVKVPV